jgi:hypothetical protein
MRSHRLASWQMSAPREYETDPGLGYGSVPEPYRSAAVRRSAGSGRPGRPRPPSRRSPRWGSLPARRGVVVVLSAAAIGAVGSLLAGSAPGAVLGILVIAGSAAAGTGVDHRRAYLLIPVPALAYVVAATVTGLFHDRGVDISHTALAVSAAQWFASGFPWMAAATTLVIAITAARWLARRHQPDAGASRTEHGSRAGRSASGTRSGRSSYPR